MKDTWDILRVGSIVHTIEDIEVSGVINYGIVVQKDTSGIVVRYFDGITGRYNPSRGRELLNYYFKVLKK